jgi:NDP-sugar pyrophosphorylase family protein
MVAVILAGGKGTRLRPFTVSIPKPLLPLGEVPILEVVLAQLAAAGFRRVIVTLGHLAHLFTAAIGDGARWGLRIDYCREETPLGTAGPLRLIPNLPDDFLVMNGDLLTTLDYGQLMMFHRARGAWGTIALHRREVRIDYGVVERDQDGSLRDYVEKPTISYAVSMGVNALSRGCLEYLPTEGRFDMPELMLAMHRAGRRVCCYEPECYWQDIGRFDDFEQASADFVADPNRFLPPHCAPQP